MTKHLDSRKVKLIEAIASLSSEKDIQTLEDFVSLISTNKRSFSNYESMRDEISLEEIKKEQNYKGFDREKFDALAKKLNIKQSLEELISMI